MLFIGLFKMTNIIDQKINLNFNINNNNMSDIFFECTAIKLLPDISNKRNHLLIVLMEFK